MTNKLRILGALCIGFAYGALLCLLGGGVLLAAVKAVKP